MLIAISNLNCVSLFMEILCNSFKLRSWLLSDAPSLALQANNPNIARQLPDAFPQPYTLEDAKGYIQFCQQNPDILFAIEVDGAVVGTIGFKKYDKDNGTAELGYWLGEAFWNQGIISGAVKSIVEYGQDQLNLKLIKAEVFTGNVASRKVLEKNGFELVDTEIGTEIKEGKAIDKWIFKKNSRIKPGAISR